MRIAKTGLWLWIATACGRHRRDFLVAGQEEVDCGENCSVPVENPAGLEECLRGKFGDRSPKKNGVPIVTFPDDLDRVSYDQARRSWRGNSYPAAVVYVRDVPDTQAALKCAVDNGYRVSVRAHGHSMQGLSTLSGYVVIDVKNTCNPDEFVVDRSNQGEHILPGSKYIATLKIQSGCTNGAVFHGLWSNFDVEDKALAVTGGWPSVGVSGCTLGGCSGEATPYAGYAIDVLVAVEVVLADGSVVEATKDNEYADLLWATQGGGGGNGIVTSYTYRIIESPAEEPLVSNYFIHYDFSDEEKQRSVLDNLQTFLYEGDPQITARFGGNGFFTPFFGNYLELTYFGDWQDGLEALREAGLYGDGVPLMNDVPTTLVEDYELACMGEECANNGEGEVSITRSSGGAFQLPASGVEIRMQNNYAEGWAYSSCGSLNDVVGVGSSGYVCDDLGIDDATFCEDVDSLLPGVFPIRKIVCPKDNKEGGKEYAMTIIEAMLNKAADPQSFMNEHGISQKYIDNMAALNQTIPANILKGVRSTTSGYLLQRLADDTFQKLAQVGIWATHFQHGAPMMIEKDATAFPWRNAAIMTSTPPPANEETHVHDGLIATIISEEEGSDFSLQGYYNTPGPLGTKNWKTLYFGENYPRLAGIRLKYDPNDVFGKPLTVELPEEDNYCELVEEVLPESAVVGYNHESAACFVVTAIMFVTFNLAEFAF